jgi:hypothetical protein
MVTIEEQAAAYDSSRRRIDEMVRPLNDAMLARTVACCPAWTVKGVVGHLTGALEDRRDQRMPEGGFSEWTDSHVARHVDEDVVTTLDTWASIPLVLDDAPPSFASLSFDAVTHEHDVCQALGVAGDHASESVRIGSERALERMGMLLAKNGAPGVVVTMDGEERVVEGASTPITLVASRYALMRLVTGRISRSQATAMSWGRDPTAVIDALFADGFFKLQTHDIVEASGS